MLVLRCTDVDKDDDDRVLSGVVCIPLITTSILGSYAILIVSLTTQFGDVSYSYTSQGFLWCVYNPDIPHISSSYLEEEAFSKISREISRLSFVLVLYEVYPIS